MTIIIKTSYKEKESKLLKTVLRNNLTLKHFEYIKENNEIVCRDLFLPGLPIVTIYKITKGVDK